MKKNEFLEELRKKLKILKQEEVDEIIKEYENTIDEKIKNGRKEEDAIKDFGSIDELTKEILDAYKISTTNNSLEDKINDFISKATKWVKELFTNISNGSAEEILNFIIKIFIVIFLICLLRFPFYLIKGIGSGLLSIFPYPFEEILSFIFRLVVELSYVIISVLIIYSSFKDKIKKYEKEDNEVQKTKKESNETIKSEKISKNINKNNHKNTSWSNTIGSIFLGLLKIFGIIFLIPFYCFVIGLFIALGLDIGLMVKGLIIIGPTIALIGIIIALICFINIIHKILFRKGDK